MKASQSLPLKGFVDPSKKDNQRLFWSFWPQCTLRSLYFYHGNTEQLTKMCITFSFSSLLGTPFFRITVFENSSKTLILRAADVILAKWDILVWFSNTVIWCDLKNFSFFFLYLSLKLLIERSRTSPGFPRKIKVHPWLFKLKELELMTPVRLSLALNSCTHWLVGSLLLLELEIGFFPRSRLRVVRWLPSKKWTFYWSLGRPLQD